MKNTPTQKKFNVHSILNIPLVVCTSQGSSVVFHAQQNDYINPIGENQIIVYNALVTNEGGAYDQYNGLFKVRTTYIWILKVTSTSGVDCRYLIKSKLLEIPYPFWLLIIKKFPCTLRFKPLNLPISRFKSGYHYTTSSTSSTNTHSLYI